MSTRNHGRRHARQGERGVTLIIVAIAMISMLAMVALAIDVITMYAARSEAQRAADAAALAAAKMLVDSGVTADPSNATLQTNAQGYATTIAQNVAQQSVISGQQVQTTNVTTTFPNNGAPSFGINPTVAVTVKSGTLPTFFSRIWSRNPLTVSASATAEAYNPSNSTSLASGGSPIVVRGVKPFLLPNCDPGAIGLGCAGTAATFFNVTTGAITRPGQAPTGIIGETFLLHANCGPGPGSCTPGPPSVGPSAALSYYPAAIPPAASGNMCPSACGGGGTNFENDIECYNPSPLTCGSTTVTTTGTLSVDTTVYPDGGGGPAEVGVKCLIHQNSGSNGQDVLNGGLPGALTYPLEIQAGPDHPLSASLAGGYVNTSDSLVTVPVYDDIAAAGAPPIAGAQIVGFLQLFIDDSFPGNGSWKAGTFHVTVVNVAGCGTDALAGTPVFPGSTSAVPVRLIHQ